LNYAEPSRTDGHGRTNELSDGSDVRLTAV